MFSVQTVKSAVVPTFGDNQDLHRKCVKQLAGLSSVEKSSIIKVDRQVCTELSSEHLLKHSSYYLVQDLSEHFQNFLVNNYFA